MVDQLLEARHGPILPLLTFSLPKALEIGSITSTGQEEAEAQRGDVP